MTCVALKKDNNVCGKTAKYNHPSDGSLRCGVHMRDVSDKDACLISGAKPTASRTSKAATAIPGYNASEVWNTMVDRIEKDLCTVEITAADKASVYRIGELDPPYMEIFIKSLLKSCPPRKTDGGSDLDYDRMIIETKTKMLSFTQSLKEKFDMNIVKFYPHCVPDDARVLEAFPCLLDDGQYVDYNENGSQLYFEDVDLVIVNCKTCGPQFMKEWLSKEENLYIGPSLTFPKLMSEDSEYFIDHDDDSICRLIQNKKDVERIKNDIKEGKDDPKKYLSLRGKTLGCVCAPYPCHAQVYVEIIRWLQNDYEQA